MSVMDNNPKDKVTSQMITGSLHSIHEILENILDSDFDSRVAGINQHLNHDPKDGLEFLAMEAHSIHELAKEVQFQISGLMEMQRKERSRMQGKISSLMKENQDISSMLKIAITEKEATENSFHILKDESEQRRSAILEIARKGLHKVGFGFIMEAISGESERKEISRTSATTTPNGRETEGVVSLASIVEKTIKHLHHDMSDLRQALDESRSDCYHFQLLAAEQAQKIIKYESHKRDLEEREIILVHNVEELMQGVKQTEQEATRWKEACELEVEAGKVAIRELTQEVTLLREESRRVKADLEGANSKLQLKEKLAATAMAAQAAADTCLKLADRRSAGLQQRIEELIRQAEQEDARGRKERGSASRRTRYICWPWPWQQRRVISESSRAKTWFVDQNGRLLPGTEALLQIRI